MAMQMIYGTRRQDAERLAQQARQDGTKLKRDRLTGQYFATSSSQPGKLYRVSMASGCECKGFAHYHRCRHYSALLAHFGII